MRFFALQANGISTFAQLAASEVAALREMMDAARLQIANPESWPEQAALAAAGDWAALATLQDNLKGGRRG
jgi:predicted flap endonuclease-1-like 5' DNA nuclease